jgi:hypothetical protein
MKIISNFVDYYDYAACPTYCNDSEIVFMRNPISIENETHSNKFCFHLNPTYFRFTKYDYDMFSMKLIGFCGKLYIRYYLNPDYRKFDKLSHKDQLNWGWYDLNTLIEESCKYFSSKKYIKDAISHEAKTIGYYKREINEIQNIITSDMLNKISLKYNTPYFMIYPKIYSENYNLSLNFNSLKHIKFFRLLDPYQTYQEIEMYFNSILIVPDNHLQITDNKVILEAKGFDFKQSFRHRQN